MIFTSMAPAARQYWPNKRPSRRLAIPQEKVFVNVEDYGNMASARLSIALDQARRAGMIQDGSLVMLVAFGSGFVWASALLRM